MKKVIYIVTFIIAGLFNILEAQWKQVETIPTEFKNDFLLDIYFLETNTNLGWACGFGGTVLITTDGGDTWAGTRVGEVIIDSMLIGGKMRYDTTYLPAVDQLESIHFPSEKIGYTSGQDRIFKTTDGGHRWNLISNPNMRIWGNFFISDLIGVAVGGGCDASGQQFHRTTDGGATWRTFEARQGETGLSDAMLLSPTGRGFASSSGRIWMTDNGGVTWDILSVTGKEDWQEEITNFKNTFLVPYANGCTGGDINKAGGLRMSTNFGKSWIDFRTPHTMFGSFLIDTLRGWGCGTKGQVYYTSDGGRNWELRDCGVDGKGLDDVWFVNDSLGWVVGDGIFKTHYYDTSRASITYNSTLKLCAGDSLVLSSMLNYKYYRWSNGDTTKSIVVRKPGTYKLESFNHHCEFLVADSVSVEFYPETIIDLQTNLKGELCVGDSIYLWVTNKYKDILWSTNEKTDSIKVNQSGTYIVTIIDTNGCEWSKSIDVTFNPLPDADILVLGKYAFCDGDSTILATSNKYSSYKWFEKSNTDSIFSTKERVTVKYPGNYGVIVTNEFGCVDTSDYIIIEVWDMTNSLDITSFEGSKSLVFDTLGLTTMECLNLKIRNQSLINVLLHSVILARNIEFSVPKKQLPVSLVPGQQMELLVCFRPLGMVDRRDTIYIGDTCSTHSIPLLGWGKSNEYRTKADCDVDIVFITDSLMGGEYFQTIAPFPNPSGGIIRVEYQRNSDLELSYELFNSFGNVIQIGKIERNQTEIQEKQIEQGEFILDLSNFSNGLYYLIIRSGRHVRSFPIVIVD